MNETDLLKTLINHGQNADKGYFHFASLVAIILPKDLREQLAQLVNGPVHDGDVVSKSARDALIDLSLGVRVCLGGNQGYTGATYFAYSVLKIINEIKSGETSA